MRFEEKPTPIEVQEDPSPVEKEENTQSEELTFIAQA